MGTFDKTYPDLYNVLMRRRSSVQEFLASENITNKTLLLKWTESAKTTWHVSDTFINEANMLLVEPLVVEVPLEETELLSPENLEEDDKIAPLSPKHSKRTKHQKLSED